MTLLVGTGVAWYYAVKANTKATFATQETDRANERTKAASAAEYDARRKLYAARFQTAAATSRAGNLTEAAKILEELAPVKPEDDDFRGFEYDYLRRTCRPELLSIEEGAVAISTDLHLQARVDYGGANNVIFLEAGLTGQRRRVLSGHRGRIVHLEFSPDGRRLLSLAEGGGFFRLRELKVWDTATGRELFTPGDLPDWLRAARFSPDGRHVAVTGGNRVWDPYDRSYQGEVWSEVLLWDVEGRLRFRRREVNWSVTLLAFSPDGQTVAAGGNRKTSGVFGEADGFLNVWDLDGKDRGTRSFEKHGSIRLAFSPDSQSLLVAAGSYDQRFGARLLDLNGASPAKVTLAEGQNSLGTLTFSPDGQTLAASDGDGLVHLWSATGQRLGVFPHTDTALALAFSPDGKRLASGYRDNQIKIWDIRTSRVVQTLAAGTERGPQALSFTPDGQRLISVGSPVGYPLRVLDLTRDLASVAVVSQEGRPMPAPFVPLSHDERRLYGYRHDTGVSVHEVDTGVDLRPLRGHSDLVEALAISRDGRRLASGGFADWTANVWDAESYRLLLAIPRQQGPIRRLALSPEGNLLALLVEIKGQPDAVVLWDVASGNKFRTIAGHPGATTAIAFSTDGKRLATVGGEVDDAGASLHRPGELMVWDLDTGERLLSLKVHEDLVRGVAFSPDDKQIATAGDDSTVRLWNSEDGAATARFDCGGALPKCVAFTPDGRRLLAGGEPLSSGGKMPGWIRLWDPVTGLLLLTLESGPGVPVEALTFTADGKRLFSAGWGFHAGRGGRGEVRVWDGRDLSPQTEACRRREALRRAAVACLTEGRWQQAVPLFDQLIAEGGADDWLLRDRRGWAYLRLKRWSEADHDFAAAVRLQPEQAQSWARRAWVNARLGHCDDAMTFYDKAIELDPAESWFWHDRGEVLTQYGQYDRAVADFARAVELHSTWLAAWRSQALLLLAQGKVEAYRSVCARMLASPLRLRSSWNPGESSAVAWICALGPNAVTDMKIVVGLGDKKVPPDNRDDNTACTPGAV